MTSRWPCTLSLCALLNSASALAQIPGVGVGWLLNPEGSRLFPQTIIYPRHPGKPDPRWKVFDWHYKDFKTSHASGQIPWRLYFYDVGNGTPSYWTAEFAAPLIESQIKELTADFEFSPKEPFSYLLFSSYREFQQANVFFIEEGVQGVTSTLEPTMAIPYWGERETFRHISHHELVHQFQVQKMNHEGGGTLSQAQLLMPLWLIEGMAEYYSLRGIDTESLALLRDLYFYPRGESKEALEKLKNYLEPGPYDFQHVYKLGQLKIAFLEQTYGKGTAQKVFTLCSRKLGTPEVPDLASALVQISGDTLAPFQEKWRQYLSSRMEEGVPLAKPTPVLTRLTTVGETLDLYALSPSGKHVLWREVDPLTGSASLWLGSTTQPKSRKQIIRDRQSKAVSLYFLQVPSIALGAKSLAFLAATALGPELELRSYSGAPEGELSVGSGGRIRLHEYGLIQAHSPTFDPDEKRLAFVGINSKGWQNVYSLDISPRDQKPVLRQLTEGAFSWKHLCWTREGILASSDHGSASGLYAIVLLSPTTLEVRPLVLPRIGHENLLEPVAKNPSQEIFLRSTNGHGQQIYRFTPESGLEQVSWSRTLMQQPQLTEQGLYALGFEKSRYHVVKLQESGRKTASQSQNSDWSGTEVTPFQPQTVQPYRAFRGTGYRLDDLGAFFSSGALLGASATVSDLMRNQIISGDFFAISGQGITQADLFFTSQEGRSTWTLGGYHTRNLRFEDSADDLTRFDETGVLGAYQYPLGPYQFGAGVLRLARANRETWQNSEWMVGPQLSYGIDLIEYELFSGPIQGFGLLVEAGTEWYPGRSAAAERLRLDIANYFKLWGRSLLAVQMLAGASFNLTETTTAAENVRNPFYVSSDDIFRAYTFGDERLRGNYLMGIKSELRFPVGEIIGFEPLRGILAADIGSIWRESDQTLKRISEGANSSWSSGFAFNIPPISFSFLFTRPLRVATNPVGPERESSVFHFTLRYLYL